MFECWTCRSWIGIPIRRGMTGLATTCDRHGNHGLAAYLGERRRELGCRPVLPRLVPHRPASRTIPQLEHVCENFRRGPVRACTQALSERPSPNPEPGSGRLDALRLHARHGRSPHLDLQNVRDHDRPAAACRTVAPRSQVVVVHESNAQPVHYAARSLVILVAVPLEQLRVSRVVAVVRLSALL